MLIYGFTKFYRHCIFQFGDEIYLVSMELYTQFVSYRLIHDLLESERFRVTPVADASPR